jgi:hypothetical protein
VKLAAAARHFDRLPVYDAYSDRQLFKAQFDLFDDSKRDAVNIQRRTLSVAPLTSMPARLAIRAGDEHWLVGSMPHSDTWMSGLIRTKYTLHKALGLATVRTPGQVIGNTGGASLYAGLAWMKDWKEVEFSSRVFPYYEVYLASSEAVTPDQFIELGGKIFRSRAVYLSEAGFKVAEADDISAARTSVTYKGPGTYSPTTDTFSGTSAVLPALHVRYAANFDYDQPSAAKRAAGDIVLLVTKAALPTAKIGDEVTYDSVLHKVISIETESDCWNLTARPA